MIKKILSLILILSIFLIIIVPAAFAVDDYTSHITNFWDSLGVAIATVGNDTDKDFVGSLIRGLGGLVSNQVCPVSEDSLHHTSNITVHGSGVDEDGSYVILVCDYCGEQFRCYASDLQESYDAYVDTLPVTGYDSDGALIWYPTWDDLDYSKTMYFADYNNGASLFTSSTFPYSRTMNGMFVSYAKTDRRSFEAVKRRPSSGTMKVGFATPSATGHNPLYFFTPVDGNYERLDSVLSYYTLTASGADKDYTSFYTAVTHGSIEAGGTVSINEPQVQATGTALSGTIHFPVYKVTPVADYSEQYTPETRVTSIVLNLATVNESQEITNVYNNTQIFNEINNTIYNPSTGETHGVNNWTFNYNDMSLIGELGDGAEFSLNFNVDDLELKIGDDTYTYNYVTPDESDTPSGGDTDSNAGLFAWLRTWLESFKTWLGEKLDALGGGDVTSITNNNDYSITYTDEDGEEQTISRRTILSKFAWVLDVFKIGQKLISVVSEDAANAYSFNVSALNSEESAEDSADGYENMSSTSFNSQVEADTLESGIMQNGAPYIPIDMSAAQSHYGYDYGGEVAFLDLSWYTPYKSTVDGIVSGFLWLFFLWKLFKKAPGIISGSSFDAQKDDEVTDK